MKIGRAWLGLLCLTAPATISAAEELPKAHFGTYGEWQNGNCRNDGTGEWSCRPPKRFSGVVISPHTAGARVWIYTWGGHSDCEFDGIGSWDGHQLTAHAREANSEFGPCKVTVKFRNGHTSTDGEGNACTSICGSWLKIKNADRLSAKTRIPPFEER